MTNLLILNQFKGINWGTNDVIQKQLYVHHHVIMIHNQLKFHDILFIGYFDTAQFVNLTLIQVL